MRPNELHEQSAEPVRHVGNKSVLVPAEIEDHAVVPDKIDAAAKLPFDVIWAFPPRLAGERKPDADRPLRLRVTLPELLQGPAGDHLHRQSLPCHQFGDKGLPRGSCVVRSAFLVMMVASLCALQSGASYAADEPDLIFKKSTVFKWVTPNDKLATYGIDDPEVEGVACHFTVPERGGLTGWIGVAEEVSDISLACRQVGPIHFKKKFAQGEDMFHHRRSLFFKKMQIVRGCDVKRNVLVYMVYSDKLIEGSPKNSTSSVPVMPWGADGQVEIVCRLDRALIQAIERVASTIAPHQP
jgi:CreA protein